MVNPGAFRGLRKEFLMNEKPRYAEGVAGGFAADAVAVIQRRYFKRFPVDLPHDEDPTGDFLASVRDQEPDPEPIAPDAERLSPEEYKAAVERFEERGKTIRYRKAQIKRWLAYQYTKDHDIDPMDSGADSPYRILLHKLTGVSIARPRQRSAVNTWRKTQREAIEAAVRKQVQKAGGIHRDKLAAFRDRVAKTMFNHLGAEEQQQWEQQAREDQEERLAVWQRELTSPPSTLPADRQKCIQGLASFFQPILDLACEATGWKASLMMGGPEPAHEGHLNIMSIHSGTTSGDVKMTFGRAQRAQYKKNFVPAFGAFLQMCYSPEECRSRALPADEGYEALHEMDLAAGGVDLDTFEINGPSEGDTQRPGLPAPAPTEKSHDVPPSPSNLPPVASPPPQDPTPLSPASQDSAPQDPVPQDSSPQDSAPSSPVHRPTRAPSAELGPPSEPNKAIDPPSRLPSPAPTSPTTPQRVAPPSRMPSPCPSPRSPFSAPTADLPLPTAAVLTSVAHPASAVPVIGMGAAAADGEAESGAPNIRMGGITSSPAKSDECPNGDGDGQQVDESGVPQVDGAQPSEIGRISPVEPTEPADDSSPLPHSTGGAASALKRRLDVECADVPSSKRPRRQAASASKNIKSAPAPRGRKALSTVQTSSPATTSVSSPLTMNPAPSSATNGLSHPVQPTPNSPKWFVDALRMLQSQSLDDSWAGLVRAWAMFEAQQDYKELGKLSTTHRPAAINEWIKRARSPTWRPVIPDITKYADDFRRWWLALQPLWRQEADGVVVRDSMDGGWEALRKPGVNGLFSVLAALYFWGLVASGDADKDSWLEAVSDCHRVLTFLIDSHV